MDNNNGNGSNGEFETYNNHHESTVTKCLDETWRLSVGAQIIFPGDTIAWNAKNADLLFGLPEEFKEFFDIEGKFEETDDKRPWQYKEQEEMYESTTCIQFVKRGDSLKLTVNEGCFNSEEESTFEDQIEIVYDILILDDNEFVIGNSSPKMIIQRPYST